MINKMFSTLPGFPGLEPQHQTQFRAVARTPPLGEISYSSAGDKSAYSQSHRQGHSSVGFTLDISV